MCCRGPLGEPGPGKLLIAHSGRVRIKADATYGAIRPGDLLVASPTRGHAMRGRGDKVRPGTVIGKALEALPAGRGEIAVWNGATVLLRTVWISNFADLIVVMTGGGPADRTQIVASYIFTQAFKALDFGYASAIALVLLVLLLAYSMLIILLRQTLLNKD